MMLGVVVTENHSDGALWRYPASMTCILGSVAQLPITVAPADLLKPHLVTTCNWFSHRLPERLTRRCDICTIVGVWRGLLLTTVTALEPISTSLAITHHH
jgi:hypothetical protein